MLLRGHQATIIPDNAFSGTSSPFTTAYSALPRRNSQSAKPRARKMVVSQHKTISINADAVTPKGISNLASNNSEQLLPNSSFSFNSNPQALNQFDNLKIEDFLKSYIVGSKKVPEDKSNDIIRSLNGTWFKSTQTGEVPSNKLFNSLGIRRTKAINNRHKQWNSFAEGEGQRKHFSKEYTPPNIFQGKKRGSRPNVSRNIMELQLSRLNLNEDSPLKIGILKKMFSSSSRTSSPNMRRSRSQFQKKKSQLLTQNQLLDISDGVIKGKRMKLHKD